jgi:ABC-type nitrate/sulfonate/bicarbonate transport system substrate-binding protein
MLARETGWAESWVRYTYGDQVHRHLRVALQPGWIEGLSKFKDFMVQHGLLPAGFAIGDWIDPSPLDDVLADQQRRRALPVLIGARTPSSLQRVH